MRLTVLETTRLMFFFQIVCRNLKNSGDKAWDSDVKYAAGIRFSRTTYCFAGKRPIFSLCLSACVYVFFYDDGHATLVVCEMTPLPKARPAVPYGRVFE